MDPVVSVIIPTFNREKMILECLDSIKNQTYRPIQVIVIDDGSSDNTHALVKKWKKDNTEPKQFEICYYYQRNSGAPSARNLGIIKSKGAYIQFLDSDDFLAPAKFADAAFEFRLNEELDLVYCLRADFNHDNKEITKFKKETANLEQSCTPQEVSLKSMWTALPVCKREVVIAAGEWDTNLSSMQDWEYFGRISKISRRAKLVPEVQAYCRNHSSNRVSNSDWGSPKALRSHARASLSLFLLIGNDDECQKDLARKKLANKSLSCLRTSLISGNHSLAREIYKNNCKCFNVSLSINLRARFWNILAYMPNNIIKITFTPFIMYKKRISKR